MHLKKHSGDFTGSGPYREVVSPALPGLLTGLSLIVAIGAQNAYVLRQGLARQYVAVVVAICTAADILLISAGVAGIGAVVTAHPAVLVALKWVGALYLVGFGLRSARSALRPQVLHAAVGAGAGLGAVVATTLALTFLNPHVYLDTVVMLGSIANQHGPSGRWSFAVGAMTASALWFAGLGFGARVLSGVFARPRTWQVLDAVIAVVMIVLAVRLLVG